MALTGLVAVLVVVIALLATASDGSALGRTRAHLGNAADSVGDALSVASPSPRPTTTPVTATETTTRLAAQTTRALIDSALGHLSQHTPAANLAAAKEYDAALEPLDEAGRGSDQAVIDQLFHDAGRVRAALLVIYPTPTR